MTAAAPQPRPLLRVRHGFLAAALLAVAGLRLVEDDHLWALVLGAGGAVELWLARRDRPATAPRGPGAVTTGPALDLETLTRSRAAHRRSGRLWGGLLTACLAAAGLLVIEGSLLAVVIAGLALVSLHRLRRERRSVALLDRVLARTDPGVSA